MAKLVAKVYGEALFEIAMEASASAQDNEGGSFLREVEVLCNLLEENPEFDKLMKHPGISKQDKLEMMNHVFQDRISKEMEGFLHIIVTKERYNDLRAIFGYFLDKIKEERKIGTAYVTTAVELNEIRKAQVLERLLATTDYREIEIRYQVDPDIIGGMIIRIKDRVVDSSIRSKLSDMKKQLLQIQLG